MFFAVVSLLTSENNPAFSDLWNRLGGVFGSYGIELVDMPHVSWHVSPGYDMEPLENTLKILVEGMKSVHARISGLGIFTGKKPVFYLPVVRSPEVHDLHLALWQKISPFSLKQELNYSPEEWIPHITLNRKVISCDLGGILKDLCSLDLRCEITLDNLAIMYRDDHHDGIGKIFPFSPEKLV